MVSPPADHDPAVPAIGTLARRAPDWLGLAVADRLPYLASLARRTLAAGPGMVADALAAKGVDGRFAGEEWMLGPVSTLRTVRFLGDTLEGIAATGSVPIPERAVGERAGRVAVRVIPADRWDGLLYRGWQAVTRLEAGVGRDELAAHLGSFHTKRGTARPGVAVVLGAGNVASIPVLDVVDQVFVRGRTAILKLSPVNDYLAPHLERIFGDLIADGFVRITSGGAEVGARLATHPEVDAVHVTGSAATHDALVWGTGAEASRRRAAGEPRLDREVSSELGNVSPVIVVPGDWSEGDLRFQAEHLATQIVHNAGFNCNAAQVIVLHRDWPQRHALLAHLRRVLLGLPPRPAYYPGAEERFDRLAGSHPAVEMLGERRPGVLPPTLLVAVPSDREHPVFVEEAFCPLVATTELGGDGASGFLDGAVRFCNERLAGTLNATVLVDSATQRDLGPALDRALDDLRYGTVAVNVWAAAGFVLGVIPWGGYPGATPEAVESGIGFVHNARLLDRPESTLVTAPFRQFPKPAWFVTHRSAPRALRALAAFEAEPRARRLPGLLLPALRS